LFSRRDVPETHVACLRARGKEVAAWRECQAVHRLRVAFELLAKLSRMRIPEANDIVMAARSDQVAVRRKRYFGDGPRVAGADYGPGRSSQRGERGQLSGMVRRLLAARTEREIPHAGGNGKHPRHQTHQPRRSRAAASGAW